MNPIDNTPKLNGETFYNTLLNYHEQREVEAQHAEMEKHMAATPQVEYTFGTRTVTLVQRLEEFYKTAVDHLNDLDFNSQDDFYEYDKLLDTAMCDALDLADEGTLLYHMICDICVFCRDTLFYLTNFSGDEEYDEVTPETLATAAEVCRNHIACLCKAVEYLAVVEAHRGQPIMVGEKLGEKESFMIHAHLGYPEQAMELIMGQVYVIMFSLYGTCEPVAILGIISMIDTASELFSDLEERLVNQLPDKVNLKGGE